VPDAPLFEVRDLHVAANDKQILSGIDLTIGVGEVHAIMGPNGSGKSTLANSLLGNPEYEVTRGQILLHGDDISDWAADVRAKHGMFMAFQYPQTIPGVTVNNLLQQAVSARRGEDQSVLETRRRIMSWMQRLEMDARFAERFLNEGFSGGEKKRAEVLQMAMLEPDIAILDETDSGLDVDALKIVAGGVRAVKQDRPAMGVLAITHYRRLLDLLEPDHVHILVDGKIVASGGMDLAQQLEDDGYEAFR
jgi:Fe-S cluster assembly ATP-binding protein